MAEKPRYSSNSWFQMTCLVLALLIVGMLVLPYFVRPTGGGREAEVKQNLHAIQLALERYAVDDPDGRYPLFVMGGDWTDSYVVTKDWVDAQPDLDPMAIEKYFDNRGQWELAPPGFGDALVMEAYMPSCPRNPFIKQSTPAILPVIEHHDVFDNIRERYVGGRNNDKMVEVFGWQQTNGMASSLVGDYFVHHIFNNPPYLIEDRYKEKTMQGPVDFNNPSGNSVLVGNFSYYPHPLDEHRLWRYNTGEQDENGFVWRNNPVQGYTLAGYGSVRTPGQDVYNRNGNYKGRYRTEWCELDCSSSPLFDDDIPCFCPGEEVKPSHLQNNGGSDTLADGVIIVLDSGVEKKTGRVNFGKVAEEEPAAGQPGEAEAPETADEPAQPATLETADEPANPDEPAQPADQ